MTESKPATESVWDYPRPPRVEAERRRITVEFAGVTIADTTRARRVLETSHPPAFYLPPDDVDFAYLAANPRHTVCEFKGMASYWDLVAGERREVAAAWSYPDPAPGYGAIRDHVAFYPGRVDGCYVDGERVRAQEGDFYGGWITAEVTGPFKGGPGTAGW